MGMPFSAYTWKLVRVGGKLGGAKYTTNLGEILLEAEEVLSPEQVFTFQQETKPQLGRGLYRNPYLSVRVAQSKSRFDLH